MFSTRRLESNKFKESMECNTRLSCNIEKYVKNKAKYLKQDDNISASITYLAFVTKSHIEIRISEQVFCIKKYGCIILRSTYVFLNRRLSAKNFVTSD